MFFIRITFRVIKEVERRNVRLDMLDCTDETGCKRHREIERKIYLRKREQRVRDCFKEQEKEKPERYRVGKEGSSK